VPPPPLLKLLVPEAPAHKRTERDITAGDAARRVRAAPFLRERRIEPGLKSPALVSSYAGAIERVLFAFPKYAVTDPALAAGYQSVIKALRPGTEFVVVHAKSSASIVGGWFKAAGHATSKVTHVPMPDYVSFTDWAEDGYVSLNDSRDGTHYLMEPWEFPRAGDALIAESVEEYTKTRTAQAPLIFQGGNCLIGDTFWLLGKDYFADSTHLVQGDRPPVEIPRRMTPETFVRRLFSDYVDARRRLTLVGTARPIPIRPYYGTRSGEDYFLDIPADGAGTFQPIFHIDMFITLVGKTRGPGFHVLVGSPKLADETLGTESPFSLSEVYDGIARRLAAAGVKVHRNPLVHRPTVGRQKRTLSELRQLAATPDYQDLIPAIDEVAAAGAGDATSVAVRTWHHITWNNCLVENSTKVGKHVYLPTYGHGPNADLKVVDDAMGALWEELGFTVHPLGDFNAFAERQGVVHCIKKYMRRGK
jgi:hypothetical protein